MVKPLVGQLVPCAARHEVIKKVPAGSAKYRSSTAVSTTNSRNRLRINGQQRWRDGVRNELSVEMSSSVLLCFQTV
jgi:hypothetical protein